MVMPHSYLATYSLSLLKAPLGHVGVSLRSRGYVSLRNREKKQQHAPLRHPILNVKLIYHTIPV